MIFSIQQEIAEMQRRWPGFRVTGRCGRIACWRGILSPIQRPYEVRITYGPQLRIADCRLLNWIPRVEIICPNIYPYHPVTGEPVPHVYVLPIKNNLPVLCLFDPDDNEWEPGRPIAHTIVHWAAQWIACYEIWLATGKWTGGGRHDVQNEISADAIFDDPLPPKEVVGNGVSRVAASTGTWSSRPILEAQIEGKRFPSWSRKKSVSSLNRQILNLQPQVALPLAA